MSFKFQIPQARYKADSIRGVDGNQIPTLKKLRRAGKPGAFNRSIILEKSEERATNEFILGKRVTGNYEHSYHATKGWRTRRVPA